MERYQSCFFTGHRIIASNQLPAVRKILSEKIEQLIVEKGVTDFVAGGALGFDTLAAECVLEMKKKYDICLHLYLPCFDQMKKWTDKQRFKGRMIMSQADEIVYTTESTYIDGCMQERNRQMAYSSHYCIAFMKNTRSGTGMSVALAKKLGGEVTNINDEIEA